MKRKNYQQPKMKLPVLKFFKFPKFWQKQKFTVAKKKKIQKWASRIDKILENLPEEKRNQLVRPPNVYYDPLVTLREWNDFLAVVFEIKPACIVGLNHQGKTYNPIAQFARDYPELFQKLDFADYWDFGLS